MQKRLGELHGGIIMQNDKIKMQNKNCYLLLVVVIGETFLLASTLFQNSMHFC